MRYCGVAAARGLLQLAMLEEVRAAEPPIRLWAIFFEPGSAAQLAAELRSLPDLAVAVAAPLSAPAPGRELRACDDELRRRGVAPGAPDPEARRLADALAHMGAFAPAAPVGSPPHDVTATQGAARVPEGAFRQAPVFETNADAVFCALEGRRLPARRHPLGIRLRIAALEAHGVVDDGGELWHRRIEEVDAAGAALCAHRYAVAHACWLGDPAEGVTVLPGAVVPGRFPVEGVLPPVERLRLPPA